MTYATLYLKYPFDYGDLRKKNAGLEGLNPDGTCFTMSCYWAKQLLERPSLPAPELAKLLAAQIMALAPIHAAYIKQTSANLSQNERNRGYVNAFKAVHVRCPTLRGSGDDFVPGISADPDPSADWMGCAHGDMWCVGYKWIMKQSNTRNFATLLGDDKHTVGIFVAKGTTQIRIWDMNAGEFVVSGEKQWRAWSKEFEQAETAAGASVKSVTLIELTREV